MTQEEALKILQDLYPEDSDVQVERDRSLGGKHGAGNDYYLWSGDRKILANSEISWEHALSMLPCYPSEFESVDTPFEDETPNA